eukprot:4489855-Prymnesium_polylepis.1
MRSWRIFDDGGSLKMITSERSTSLSSKSPASGRALAMMTSTALTWARMPLPGRCCRRRCRARP